MAASFHLSAAALRGGARAPQGLGERVRPAVREPLTHGLTGSAAPAGVGFSHRGAAPEQFYGPVPLS